ncbi:MAG: TetR/AcrR family transcriptional regulator [Planctomycetes bacterium]|nr:TetR/AcrR family transcriptional regulator [Planctomycetota bacterium]
MPEDTRAQILRAAKTLFGRYGFRKTSLADVAGEARMGKSSIYYYFTSKEDLFRAVVDAEFKTLSARVRDAIASESSPEASFRTYVLTRMRVARELASAYAALHDDYLVGLPFVEEVRHRAFQEEVQTIEAILEDGIRGGAFEVANPGLTAYAIAVSLKGLEYPWLVDSDDAKLESDLDLLLKLLMKAIGK